MLIDLFSAASWPPLAIDGAEASCVGSRDAVIASLLFVSRGMSELDEAMADGHPGPTGVPV
jgi:hypothetical protein